MESKKSQNGKRMFRNPVMELLSLSHPAMMVPFHLALIILCYRAGMRYNPGLPILSSVLILTLAFLTWTLAEYLLHRYLFHWISEDNRVIKAFHYALHGYHHEEPLDANRLYMPPLPASLFLALFLGIFYLLMGHYAWFFLAGFESGYLLYSSIHYSVHTRKAPKLLRFLWKHHNLHHYKYPDKAFGVSSRLWDRIFGTMPPRAGETGNITVKALKRPESRQ